MKIWLATVMVVLAPLPATANCIPPWQTQFACNIPDRNARAEFCRIDDTKANPGKKEAYYSYATGSGPTELYFETDNTLFSTKDTDINHRLCARRLCLCFRRDGRQPHSGPHKGCGSARL
jgi:hypothetical protein